MGGLVYASSALPLVLTKAENYILVHFSPGLHKVKYFTSNIKSQIF